MSLGRRVLLAGMLLFLSPLALVLVSPAVEEALDGRTRYRTEECAREVARAFREGRSPSAPVETVCRPHRLRVEIIVDGTTRTISDDLADSGLVDRAGDLLYGSERAAALAAYRSTRPAPGRVCVDLVDANLRVCSVGVRAERGGRSALVHVTGSSRNARAARYQQRRLLAATLSLGALLAIGLVIWLRRSVSGPVQALAGDIESLAERPAGRLDEARPRELAEVARAFNRLRDDLRRAGAEHEGFLADLAHEMKNPVSAISAAAETLAASPTDDPVRRERLVSSIAAGSSRLSRLIGQFLELARAEAGLPRDERERVDLGELARGVASTVEPPEGKTLAVDGPDAPACVEGVPVRLESALRNLIENALSFARTRVAVVVRSEGGLHVVEVEDDGPGIAPEDLGRVFERFHSTREGHAGTGLGLAIVRAIAAAHGGRVDVRSDASGTTFALSLPGA